MKKFLLLCFILLTSVFIYGCISKSPDIENNSVDTKKSKDELIEEQLIDIYFETQSETKEEKLQLMAETVNGLLIQKMENGDASEEPIMAIVNNKDFDPNVTFGALGETPFISAVFFGSDELVDLMIKKGANINTVVNGYSALEFAKEMGRHNLVRKLKSLGAWSIVPKEDKSKEAEKKIKDKMIEDIQNYSGELFAALLAEDPSELEHFLNYGKRPGGKHILDFGHDYFKDKVGLSLSPLMYTAFTNDIKKAKLLLDAGARIDFAEGKNESGYTALFIAAQLGHLDFVKFLLENGADINKTNPKGENAIILATVYNKVEVVKYLKSKGAKFNIEQKDPVGATLLLIAVDRGHYEITEYLLKLGANVNAQMKGGYTALMIATMDNREDLVKLLLNYGPDISIKDDSGATAFVIATRKKYYNITNILLNSLM